MQLEHRQGLQVQETQYDPTGLELAGLAPPSPGIRGLNNYRFNGKELQTDLGLNWTHQDWRFIDLARGPVWFGVDPEVENGQESMSPYVYNFNNAVRYADPNGRCPTCLTAGIGALVGFGIGAYKYGFRNGGWKKVAAATAAGAVVGFTGGLGASAVVGLGGIEAIGGANVGYIALGTGVAGDVAGNLTEQGVNNLLGSQAGFDQQDFMVNMIVSVPMGATGVATEGAKEMAKDAVGSAIKESMGRAASSQERKDFIRQEAKAIRQAFADAGGRVSNRDAKKAAGKIFNAAEQAKEGNVNATISVGQAGVTVGTTAVENIVSDKIKDKAKQ